MNRSGEDIASDLDGIAKEIDDTNYTFVHMRQEKMRSLTARRDVLLEEHKAALERQSYVTIPVYGWACFHCGERFYEVDKAREHFGTVPSAKVVCDKNPETYPKDANGFTAAERQIMRDDPT
jgi:hypothetical protein